MRYVVQKKPESQKMYATHLRTNAKADRLIWNASPDQDVLVVQTKYNSNALEEIETICEEMNAIELPTDRFTCITGLPNTWVRYVSSSDYTRDNGCMLNDKACSYTIFCTALKGDQCIVYYQDAGRAGNLPYRNIRLEIPIHVHKVTQTVGFFRKVEVDTGFYQITLPREYEPNVGDGDVYYIVPSNVHLEIPITKKMFKNGVVFIRTNEKPKILSKFDGLRIIQSN